MAELSSNRTGGNGVQVETDNEKFNVKCSRPPQTLEIVISRFCLAEDGEDLYQNLERTFRAFVFLITSHFCDFLIAVAVVAS